MKKFFALVVSLILILSLTACGGSDSSTDSAPDSGASSADPAAKTEIVYGKSQGPYTELCSKQRSFPSYRASDSRRFQHNALP